MHSQSNPTVFENAPTSPHYFIPDEGYFLCIEHGYPIVGCKVESEQFKGYEFEVRALVPGGTEWDDMFCECRKMFLADAIQICLQAVRLEVLYKNC